MRHYLLWKRLNSIRPQRMDGPLRYLNVSDEEVREIKGAAFEVVGNVLVHIGGVISGCPCEDGPKCTDQVWVQAEIHEEPFGLLLSRIDNHWVIGPMQRWWWRYEKASYEDQDLMINELPSCGVDEKLQDILKHYHVSNAKK